MAKGFTLPKDKVVWIFSYDNWCPMNISHPYVAMKTLSILFYKFVL
jgi:hypothetical protein